MNLPRRLQIDGPAAPREDRYFGSVSIGASLWKQLFCCRMHSENSSSCGVSLDTIAR